MPSTFLSVRSLYAKTGGAELLSSVLDGFVQNLEKHGSLVEGGAADTPATKLWLKYILALHYDQLRQVCAGWKEWRVCSCLTLIYGFACGRQHDKALQLVEEAIKHTPTAIDFYTLQGRILKVCGGSGILCEM